MLAVATVIAGVAYLRGSFDGRCAASSVQPDSDRRRNNADARESFAIGGAADDTNAAMGVLPTRQLRTRQAAERQVLDPLRDGWGTEAFATSADTATTVTVYYVGNMFSAAGNRITFQDQFRPGTSRDVLIAYQRLARGNTLLKNNGDGTFRDGSEETGETVGKWSWGSVFVDINNDGWDDLLVDNGSITQQRADDL